MQNTRDQPCEICGDIGIAEVIATCSKCHKSRQHIYCMRRNLLEVPESWYCETCRLNNLDYREACHSDAKRCHQGELQDSSKWKKARGMINVPGKPVASKTTGPSSATPRRFLSRNFVPKKVETGKVKFLALDEIYALSSPAKPNPSPPHSSRSSQIASLGISHLPLSRRTSLGVSASSPKKVHAPTIGKEPWLKSPSQFQCRSSTSENSKSVEDTTTKDKGQISDDAHSPLLNTGHVVCGVQEKHNLENKFPGLDKRAGKVNSSLSKNYMRNEKVVVAAVRNKEYRTSNSTAILKFGEEDLPNPRAVNHSWKGSFVIDDFPGKLYDGFHAYPPGKVSRKAFLVSRQMPSVLKFTLQHRSNVWPETFKADPPSGSDIALYFLANDIYRSRDYNHLLELLENKDLSMQSHLDGVDLLIFTSRQLPLESQRMNKQFYLWGVFVCLKERQSVDKKGKHLAFSSPLLNHKISEDPAVVSQEANTEEVDMEIDMVGGREVGTVDMVVSQEANTEEVDMEIDMVGGREVGTVDIFLRRNSISACLENSDIPSQSDSLDTPPGFSKSSALIKVSPGSLKVNAPVDKRCRNSRPAYRNNSDVSSGNVLAIVTSSHKDTPPGFSRSSALVKMSPGTNKLDTHCLSKPIKLEERDSSPKCALESGKCIVVARQTIGGSGDEEDVVCMVCREGYNSRPNDILGIYTYSKRVDLDIGTSASSRSVRVYTTVSNFNIVHFHCLFIQAAADPENRKNEWEGLALSNREAFHNCIFPLRGPFVQLPQYQNRVSKYWDTLNLLHGPAADGSHLQLLTYDIVLMLSRFASGDSFNTDGKADGRESNACFLPFMIQMAQSLIEQERSLTQRETMANAISSYLSFTSAKSNSSAPPGFRRPCGTDETVQYMMLNSLFFESYESWLTHRRAFLQRAIYHAYLQNMHGRPVHALPSVETCLKSEHVDESEIFDQSNYLFFTTQPMLVYTGLIEQLQSFLKLSNTRNATDVKIEKNDKSNFECWELIMKAKLVNVKEMMDFSKRLLSWLDDMNSAKDLEEAFFVMGALTDVLSAGFSSCEGFVQAAIQSGKGW